MEAYRAAERAALERTARLREARLAQQIASEPRPGSKPPAQGRGIGRAAGLCNSVFLEANCRRQQPHRFHPVICWRLEPIRCEKRSEEAYAAEQVTSRLGCIMSK